MTSRLGLGTAQFGMEYGVTNKRGMPTLSEVEKIIGLAQDAGVQVIDTAPAYGTSEERLGMCWPADSRFKIVTKTPVFRKARITTTDAQQLRITFQRSLHRLRQASLYGLLIHHADDLLAEGGELLMQAMCDLREQHLVQKIGVSVYTASQIEAILELYQINLIQVPLNVLDQRLLRGGILGDLAGRGIEIHARSVFLQGILLCDPMLLAPYFDSLRPLLRAYQRYLAEVGLTSLQGAIAFVATIPEIAAAIVGVSSPEEFEQILSAVQTIPAVPLDFTPFACSDVHMLNPSLWQVQRPAGSQHSPGSRS